MRINYFSDIHLEFGRSDVPNTNADIVIAAGDIGVYDQGIAWLKRVDKPVIYIAGNHEYYGHEYQDTLRMLKAECAHSNIHFLENNSFKFNGVRFLGCTLWADLFVEGNKVAKELEQNLNDFKKIRYADRVLNPTQFSELYSHSREWLEKALAKPYSGKTVVITHHAPTQRSWHGLPNASKKLAYCNDLKSLFYQYNISAWFHGHTHSIANYQMADAKVLSNTRGYADDRLVNGFNLNRTVVI